jgi:holo-[acyl-carrier protein] synthase
MIVGTGVDIVEIERLRRIVEKQKDRFLSRVFTLEEQRFCNMHRDPAPHFAARFAAKEAVFKALGTGWAKGVKWVDVEVRREGREAPLLALYGEALKISQSLGARKSHISLSHSDNWALAMAILES